MNQTPSPNFAFLDVHDPRLVVLGTQAENHFNADPAASLAKLRTYGEFLARRAAALTGLYIGQDETQSNLIRRLMEQNLIDRTQKDLFHRLREVGNKAAHQNEGNHGEALHQLKIARELGIWFHRTFGPEKAFQPSPFVPPQAPPHADATLREEIQRLNSDLDARRDQLKAALETAAQARAALHAEQAMRLSAEEQAQKAREELALWDELTNEQAETYKAQLHRINQELMALQARAAAQSPQQKAHRFERAAKAGLAIELDEAATRRIIDQQLRAAGWEADSQQLRYAKGTRPVQGKNMAIAEWPTYNPNAADDARKEGRADYILFAGLTPIAVVEAKRFAVDVSQRISQARDYSLGYVIKGGEKLPEGSPWGAYKIPFVFAANGHPFIRQFITKSGIWFLDVRRPQNHPTALDGWYTPQGLLERLKQNTDQAHQQLKTEPMPYIDREYQQKAILAAEHAIEQDRREVLLAMATGTGKTRTCIGLCYRLLKTNRFRRILFLVDRNALGVQMTNVLKDLRLEQMQTFHEIFGIKERSDAAPDNDTRLHVATIQAMVKRILGPHDENSEARIPPVDQYDCIVVDECHRGYLLDRELSDRELLFRDEADYISKYRRVLDHFDAVKIGLTATPALHTVEIFGPPVFQYTYPEAVIDGFLVDHEPPIRIITHLAKNGIHYEASEEINVLNRSTGKIQLEIFPDEQSFEIDSFHRTVITENWNRAVLRDLTRHIDPEGEEKTLIFCVNDEHANLVVELLKKELEARYGEVDNDAVEKITGEADHPLEKIRLFRNERLPNIAVTVDLLTTGIDVPRIANLVFLRRVKSHILYQQMLGRATRLCPEIQKECFRIFDAVDLYSAFQAIDDMKPVVVNPTVSFEQLAFEIIEGKEDEYRAVSQKEYIAKLQRKKATLKPDAVERIETAAGQSLKDLLRFLKTASPGDAAAFLSAHPGLTSLLDQCTGRGGTSVVISDHPDHVIERGHGYGEEGRTRPADYLEAFKNFIESNLNKIPALTLVAQRPRDLTREDLRSLKLSLSQAGFSETHLQTALREEKNEDIAATIIGYIRRFALGSPLIPYSQRVDQALLRLRKRNAFTAPQDKWLQRIGEQLKIETIVDKASLDRGQFQAIGGGFQRLNKLFDGRLEMVLGELSDEVWKDAV